MKLIPYKSGSTGLRRQAFTMIEVALSLAIVAFALVAVIGVLPTGMQVQKDNREETIIHQDAMFLMDVLKNGETNAVSLAQNFEWIESYTSDGVTNGLEGRIVRSNLLNGTFGTNEMAYRLVGLLSTPRFVTNTAAPNGYVSNWVQAKFVANSGPLADRLTQDPVRQTRDFAFAYLVTVDIAPVIISSTNQVYHGDLYATNYQANLYELRLTLKWPVYPNNTVGNGRKSFGTLVAGRLARNTTNGLYQFRPNEFTGIQP